MATLELTASVSNLEARKTTVLTAALKDANGATVSGTVTWSSSNPTVATVTSGGQVLGLTPGAVRITATSGSASDFVDLTIELADMEAFVESVRSTYGMPAMGGALVTIDGLVALGVSGQRRAGGPVVTVDDQWHIGSNLKAVTGFLCGMAVDDGVISWETTVSTMFPELTSIHSDYQSVTLEDLCTNQSGLPANPTGLTLTASDPQGQRDEVAAWAFEQSSPAAPRGTYYYSNIGYAMAGAMLERAWSTTYEAALQNELFDPIGVTSADWGPQTAPGASDNPVPHSWNGSGWTACEGCDNPPWLSAAGRMHVDLSDWARIIQEMLKADDGTSTLVSAGTGAKIMNGAVSTGTDQYGYGWIVTSRPWANGRTLTHAGSNTVNHSVVWMAPERGFAILALTNAAGGQSGQALDALVVRLLDYFEEGS